MTAYYLSDVTRKGLLMASLFTMSLPHSQAEQPIKWTALSHTAYSITGDLETTDSAVIFGKTRLNLNLARKFKEGEIGHAAKLFTMKPDDRAQGELYRTKLAARTKLLNGNSLCGKSEVPWVVELRDGKDIYLAFFSGTREPNLTPAIVDNSLDLCGTYWYEKTVR